MEVIIPLIAFFIPIWVWTFSSDARKKSDRRNRREILRVLAREPRTLRELQDCASIRASIKSYHTQPLELLQQLWGMGLVVAGDGPTYSRKYAITPLGVHAYELTNNPFFLQDE